MPADTDRRRFPLALRVLRTAPLSTHMHRVVLGGPAFDDFLARSKPFTDQYVKLLFLKPDVDYPDPLDAQLVRAQYPPEAQPTVRTYTVRRVEETARELTIDFVVHGDEGVAGPWAVQARPGDTLHMLGPGGAYAPSEDADWHLLAGDEAALPAIAAAIEAMPAGAPVHAFIEVDGPEEHQTFSSAADLHLTWLHRDGARAGTTTLIPDAVRGLDWPAGRAQVFIHGESGLLKALRSHLHTERGLERHQVSLSGYWRAGASEEGFRAWKAEQRAAV